jgi:Protein of unknown function DUF262/Protein of unknown function (DUF1524)
MARELGEAPGAGIGKLLQDERFIVPTHQRDYSWSVSEVSLLLDDVEAAIDRKDRQYFVGLMVFMGGEGREQIVLDGQQRLATVVIYYSAVRNWLSQYSEYKRDSTKVDEWYIGRSEIGKNEAEPRIILNAANHQTFLDYIVKAVPVSDLKAHLGRLKKYDRNRNMIEAAIYCHERIAGLAKGGETSARSPEAIAQRLFQIVSYFSESVEIVRLNVMNEETAFTIFETLNDRGVELSPLDLVKNHLFRRAAAQSKVVLRDMEERWVQMMATLSNVNSNAFLKAYWTSRHGRIQAPSLFAEFKKRNESPAAVLSTSVEMLSVSEQYAALETSDDVVWSPYSPETREAIRSLKLLGARQVHPVLLAALKRFDVPEVERLLRLLETVIVRYQLIGGGRTGKLEIECARLAQAIYNRKVVDKDGTRSMATASDVFREWQEVYPSDSIFEAEFSHVKETNNQKCVYLLRRLERQQRRIELQNRAPENELGAVTLEHILPKKPSDEWEATLKADKALAEDCTYRLGNMCLMVKGENKAADRSGFPKKKKFYARSNIRQTRDIATEYAEWNRETIEKHQAAMAKLAVAVWRFR